MTDAGGNKLAHILDDGGAAFRAAFPVAGFLGMFGTGKDTSAQMLGYRGVVKFAAPLYSLAKLLIPDFDKALPGGRRFLQQLGAWGRRDYTEVAPVSLERHLMKQLIVSWVNTGALPAHWSKFGNPNFWYDAALAELTEYRAAHPDHAVAITDARYRNEVEGLYLWGAPTFLVACRPETLEVRRRACGYANKDGNDSSEDLANSLTRHLMEGNEHILWGTRWLAGILWADDEATCPAIATPLNRVGQTHARI